MLIGYLKNNLAIYRYKGQVLSIFDNLTQAILLKIHMHPRNNPK